MVAGETDSRLSSGGCWCSSRRRETQVQGLTWVPFAETSIFDRIRILYGLLSHKNHRGSLSNHSGLLRRIGSQRGRALCISGICAMKDISYFDVDSTRRSVRTVIISTISWNR